MRGRNLHLLIPTLAAALACCSQPGERGNPAALNPILGSGGPAARPGAAPPSEPVTDYAADLGALVPAWPAAPQELPRLIRAVIARGSWVDEHHTVVANQDALRVRHRPQVVAQVRRLVDELRGRLLRPLDIQVALVEVNTATLPGIYTPPRKGRAERWDGDALRKAVRANQARVLSRAVLTGYNGQWVNSDRVGNNAYVSGFSVDGGSIKPTTTALASGFTIQAAAWRWGEERAVVACTGLYTGQASGTQQVEQTIHRELPRLKTTERQWEAHQVKLSLPVREMVEFQGQITVTRRRWAVAALMPRDSKRVNAVLVKVSWQAAAPPKTRVDPLAAKDSGYVLDVVPVALPTDTRPFEVKNKAVIGNRRDINANAVGWFRDRAKSYQGVQQRNTYNLKTASGEFNFSPENPPQQSVRRTSGSNSKSSYSGKLSGLFSRRASRGTGAGPSGVMPEALEAARNQVMRHSWPAGTAVEFMANHVFVVHRPTVTAKVRALLAKVHAWRNRRVLLEVGFPVLTTRGADTLRTTGVDARRLAAMRRSAMHLPGALLQGRGGTWSTVFAGEMHAVLSGAWAPDRPAPSVHVFWRGNRLAAQPRLSPDAGQSLDLRWKQHRLNRVAPQTVAGTVLQQPLDATWAHSRLLRLEPGAGAISGLHGEGASLRALLVTAHSVL